MRSLIRLRGNGSGAHYGWRAGCILGVGLLVTGLAATGSLANDGDAAAVASAAGRAGVVQTECPVMIGNTIDPNLYTDYRGKRVFFCCAMCKSSFAADPEKYLPRLPQFAGVTEADVGHKSAPHEHAEGFSGARLIEPMGIATISLVAAAVCLAVFRRRVRMLKPATVLKIHKVVGVAALVAGIIHAALVLSLH